jgi:hypothetical protein
VPRRGKYAKKGRVRKFVEGLKESPLVPHSWGQAAREFGAGTINPPIFGNVGPVDLPFIAAERVVQRIQGTPRERAERAYGQAKEARLRQRGPIRYAGPRRKSK